MRRIDSDERQRPTAVTPSRPTGSVGAEPTASLTFVPDKNASASSRRLALDPAALRMRPARLPPRAVSADRGFRRCVRPCRRARPYHRGLPCRPARRPYRTLGRNRRAVRSFSSSSCSSPWNLAAPGRRPGLGPWSARSLGPVCVRGHGPGCPVDRLARRAPRDHGPVSGPVVGLSRGWRFGPRERGGPRAAPPRTPKVELSVSWSCPPMHLFGCRRSCWGWPAAIDFAQA